MSGLQAAGVAVGIGGAVAQYRGQSEQAEASKRAEELRAKQMELESARKQREIIRRAQLANAQALATTTSQTGSAATASSALSGAQGQISQDAATNLGFEGQALGIGRGIFAANAQYAEAGKLTALGGAMGTIGSSLIKSSGQLNEMSTSLFGGKRAGYKGPSNYQEENFPWGGYL
jgi:hypothetical protein